MEVLISTNLHTPGYKQRQTLFQRELEILNLEYKLFICITGRRKGSVLTEVQQITQAHEGFQKAKW